MDRIAEAFTWPFRDPDWLPKLLIIALILLVAVAIGVVDQGTHLRQRKDAVIALVIVLGSLATIELADRVAGDPTFAGGFAAHDRERP